MPNLTLTPIAVTDLNVFVNPCDLRRDLGVFVEYVQSRQVKRLHRSNGLSKPDANRLAKLMSDPEATQSIREHGDSPWIDFVDNVALDLGFVSYDTKGVYAGYSSREPSFPDNYIRANRKRYAQFLSQSLNEQETTLLETLLKRGNGCSSEFFTTSLFGRLDPFSSFGCGVAVVPTLDFPHIRRTLLHFLQPCQAGFWYSTESLIQALKSHHPYFLIPQSLAAVQRWGRNQGRYVNFGETQDRWGHGDPVPDDAPDAFERVEGRYVERFLEGLLLTLGYVDVAYTHEAYQGRYPTRNVLRAFRLNGRLARVLQGEVAEPKVTVQPNFEIYVESEFYPAYILAQLTPLTDLLTEDVLTVLKLRRDKVAAAIAADESLDVLALLRRLSAQDLPHNVVRELTEWSEHSEKFTLYEGFGLLEGDKHLPAADPFTFETITPKLRIVNAPGQVFAALEAAELIPMRVNHRAATFQPMPKPARTLFPKQKPPHKPTRRTKPSVTVQRQVSITLQFTEAKALQRFRQLLLKARCPAEIDDQALTVTYAQAVEPQVQAVLKALKKTHKVVVQEQ